jgi:Tfp pilus assembly protein PilO
MNQRIRLSRGGAVAAIVAGDLVLLVLGWFLLVGPQRSTAASIKRAAAATEAQAAQASAELSASTTPVVRPKQPEIKTAYLYKLSKAMPMTTDMPNLLLELNRVVQESGVQLASISPTPPDLTGTSAIQLTVTGDFYSLTDLLYRLRSLVGVHNDALDVSGRLFSVKSVDLTPTGNSRQLNANISLNAFTFSAAAATSVPSIPITTTDTSSTATTTTTSSPSADSAVQP